MWHTPSLQVWKPDSDVSQVVVIQLCQLETKFFCNIRESVLSYPPAMLSQVFCQPRDRKSMEVFWKFISDSSKNFFHFNPHNSTVGCYNSRCLISFSLCVGFSEIKVWLYRFRINHPNRFHSRDDFKTSLTISRWLASLKTCHVWFDKFLILRSIKINLCLLITTLRNDSPLYLKSHRNRRWFGAATGMKRCNEPSSGSSISCLFVFFLSRSFGCLFLFRLRSSGTLFLSGPLVLICFGGMSVVWQKTKQTTAETRQKTLHKSSPHSFFSSR